MRQKFIKIVALIQSINDDSSTVTRRNELSEQFDAIIRPQLTAAVSLTLLPLSVSIFDYPCNGEGSW